MNIAIIDLGTNTFKLLIIDESEAVVYKSKLTVKLGEDGLNDNIIAPDAYKRGINALVKHKKIITEHQCEKIFTFATSGLRSTNNGGQFIEEVRTKIGIDIKIIDGDQEAVYIYHGVKKALPISENSCIMDIGGGSTEFIICNEDKILWKKSYKLGVSRLFEKFKPKDPLTEEEINKIESYLKLELTELFNQLKLNNVTALIGSSGSFKLFAKIIGIGNNSDNYYAEISREKIDELHTKLISKTVFQRLLMEGMDSMRAEMTPMASVMVNFILNTHHFSKISVSKYSLKEGVISDVISAT